MKIQFLLWLFVCLFSSGAPILTVIGRSGEMKLSQFGLLVKEFDFKSELKREEALPLCEAIDGSQLVLFMAGTDCANAVFADASVRQAVARLFQRGGGFYLSVPSWTWMTNRPKNLFAAFRDFGVELPGDYKGFGQERTTLSGRLAPDFATAWPASPNKDFKIAANGHMGVECPESWQQLFIAGEENFLLALIKSDISGGGTLIYNYATSVHRYPVSPFIENLVSRFYGQRNLSRVRKPDAREGAGSAESSDAFYLDLTKHYELEMGKADGTGKPECPTVFTTSYENGVLKLHFDCQTGAPDQLKRRFQGRDESLWMDDCIEVFITDSLSNSANVFQFIVNANGALYDSRNKSPLWNCEGITYGAKISAKGYEVELAIPLHSLGIQPGADAWFRLNFCREARTGVTQGTYELQSWRPSSSFAVPMTMATAGFVSIPPAAKGNAKPAGGGVSKGVRIYRTPFLTAIFSDFEPVEEVAETETIHITLARNDREGVPIVLVNDSSENLRYRLEPEWEVKGSGQHYSELLAFKEVLPYRALSKQVSFEIVSGLNECSVISVPGNDVAALYLDFMTRLPPGLYEWGFTLIPINCDVPQRSIKVVAEVLGLTMPARLPLDFYLYGPYVAGQRYHVGRPEFTKGQFDRWIKRLQEYHVNIIHVADPFNQAVKIENGKVYVSEKAEDYLFNEEALMASGLDWSYHYGVWAVLMQRLQKAGLPHTLKDPGTREIFELAMARWSAFLQKYGIDFKRFWVPVWDEPRSADLPEVLIAAEIAHKNGFRVHQTMANWSVVDDFEVLKNSVDYWIPLEYLLTMNSTAPQVMKIIQESGKPFSPYMCSIGGTVEDYHGYFRFRGIREYLTGASGIFLWALNSWRGNNYDSREDKVMRGMFLVHHSDHGPVPTMRFEALREGLEDMYYLNLAKKSSSQEARALVEPDVLNGLMEKSNPVEMETWKGKLLRALSESRMQIQPGN